jgi:myo-inositol 2-dehydrogenase/D-chiro-inositol 1-dehydrogenase
MRQVSVGVIGTGWCGGIRAVTAAESPLVSSVHIAEIRPDRLAEVVEQTGAVTATTDYREPLANPRVDAVMVATTPETTHTRSPARPCKPASTSCSRSRSP